MPESLQDHRPDMNVDGRSVQDQTQMSIMTNNSERDDDPTKPKWVSIHSKAYERFIQKIEMNWEGNTTKLSICILCWAFLSFSLKKKHMEHSHYVLTPSFIKNEEMFLKLAKKHKKMSEDEQNVQIFADK